ncbi:MAG: Lrp/AsnC family transcriptional regulator [Armatimonadetes bacterium]|nr:Lrp/AsnC family transcriptional regulator [Armatimonadota bacterium]
MAALDHLDLALIARLQDSGRTPLVELAKQLGVSHGTIRNRLERLQTDGILKVVATVEPVRVGFPIQVLIGINADLRRMVTIEKHLATFQEVTFVATLTGRLDFIIGAAFASSDDLRHFLQEKLAKVAGIRRTETFHILDLGKRLWQWAVPVATARPPQSVRRARRRR